MSKDNDTYQQGLKIRREVMGDAHVNRAMDNASEFSMPLQDRVMVKFGFATLSVNKHEV